MVLPCSPKGTDHFPVLGGSTPWHAFSSKLSWLLVCYSFFCQLKVEVGARSFPSALCSSAGGLPHPSLPHPPESPLSLLHCMQNGPFIFPGGSPLHIHNSLSSNWSPGQQPEYLSIVCPSPDTEHSLAPSFSTAPLPGAPFPPHLPVDAGPLRADSADTPTVDPSASGPAAEET